MFTYKHTQVGYLMIITSLVVALLYIFLYKIVAVAGSSDFVSFTIVMTLAVFIISSFSTLQVIVDDQYVRIKFGYGIFRKKFALREIASAQSVRNHWYYGWGIRMWFKPYMRIYNVSGFDAVEIIMKDGKRFRIGTDVPKELESAINLTLSILRRTI